MLNRRPVEQEHLINALEEFIKQILPAGSKLDARQLAQDTANILQKSMSNKGEELTVDKLADPQLINQVTNTAKLLADLKSTPALVKALDITNEKLADPKFVNQLSVAMKLTANIKNTPELMKGLEKLFKTLTGDGKDPEKLNKLMADFKKLVNKPDKNNIREEFKMLLSKHLGSEGHGALLTQFDKFMNDLKKMTPGKNKNEKTQVDDPYINLLGVLNSFTTGSLPVPTPQDMGNGLAIPDMNPYDGSANIDKPKSLNFSWGDSLGLEDAEEDKLEALGAAFISALHHNGIKLHKTPGLPTSPAPPGEK